MENVPEEDANGPIMMTPVPSSRRLLALDKLDEHEVEEEEDGGNLANENDVFLQDLAKKRPFVVSAAAEKNHELAAVSVEEIEKALSKG
jgi:hypothetical protein